MTHAFDVEQAVLSLCDELLGQSIDRNPFQLDPDHLWAGLVACLLSSQVKYELATSATVALEEAGLLLWDPDATDDSYQARVEQVLSSPLSVAGKECRYRFPVIRSSQIVRARRVILRQWGDLKVGLACHSEEERRRLLIDNIPGFGPKQSSMFLRNTGLATHLAILDVHSLKFMMVSDLIRRVPRSPSASEYFTLESILQNYAIRVGFPMSHLDRAIWAVMRVYGTEIR